MITVIGITLAIWFYLFVGPWLGLFGVVWKAKWILIKLVAKSELKSGKTKLIFNLLFCSQTTFGEILDELDLIDKEEIEKLSPKKKPDLDFAEEHGCICCGNGYYHRKTNRVYNTTEEIEELKRLKK